MHELSIALCILELAEAESLRHVGRVTAVHLRLGPLSGVVREALVSAYDLAREGSPLEGAELIVEEVPIAAYCSRCAEEVVIPSIQDLRCSRCGAPAPEIIRGSEMDVVALEIAS